MDAPVLPRADGAHDRVGDVRGTFRAYSGRSKVAPAMIVQSADRGLTGSRVDGPNPRPPNRAAGAVHLVLHLHRLDDADNMPTSTRSPFRDVQSSTVPCIGARHLCLGTARPAAAARAGRSLAAGGRARGGGSGPVLSHPRDTHAVRTLQNRFARSRSTPRGPRRRLRRIRSDPRAREGEASGQTRRQRGTVVPRAEGQGGRTRRHCGKAIQRLDPADWGTHRWRAETSGPIASPTSARAND